MEIGNKIRKVRIEKGISQEYLSKILGVSQNTVHKIESGKKEVNVNDLLKISEALEEPITTFLELPIKVEMNNCKDCHCNNFSTVTINHMFPPELIKILEKVADKL